MMTGQIADVFLLKNEEFSLIGVDGETLFDPREHGLNPKMATTACWRGFQLFYLLKDDKLILNALSINLKSALEFNGIKPKKTKNPLKYLYEELDFPVAFSGKILLGNEFISNLYVHMGFQSPQSFKKVLELEFANGKLISIKDLSKEMKKRREKGEFEGYQPDSRNTEDIKDWVEDKFSLSYDST